MPLILPSNTITGGYEVDNSLRFDDGSSDYLNRTPTTTNQKTWTWSGWIKKTSNDLGISNHIFNGFYGGDTRYTALRFLNTNALGIIGGVYSTSPTTTSINLTTNRLFRDVSAWYHIVLAIDTTQSTSSDRVKIYVNGVQETSFSTATYPALNADTFINVSTSNINLGFFSTQYFDGYMAEVVFIDGQQLDATSFGEFDEDSGIWKPINVSGLTFGTNGFYLDFENSGSLGADVSGNGNDFTVNNLTSIDQTTDTPTNNFATYNNLIPSTLTYSEGNCKAQRTTSDWEATASTISVTQGKWYAEFKCNSSSTMIIGIEDVSLMNEWQNQYMGKSSNGVGYTWDARKFVSGSSSSYGSTFTTNDIIGVALDMDNGFVYFSKNGTWQNSGDPESGATGTGGISFSGTEYVIGIGAYSSTISANYGNPPYSITSSNSDANGYGNFEYSVPSGYYALNTKNLAEFG